MKVGTLGLPDKTYLKTRNDVRMNHIIGRYLICLQCGLVLVVLLKLLIVSVNKNLTSSTIDPFTLQLKVLSTCLKGHKNVLSIVWS